MLINENGKNREMSKKEVDEFNKAAKEIENLLTLENLAKRIDELEKEILKIKGDKK